MSREVRSVQRRLGLRIQALRQQREQTQDALARQCGISQKYLSELERGEKAPSLETLVALAHDGFDIHLAVLMFGVDEDIPAAITHLETLLAGRSADDRGRILQAVELLLETGVFTGSPRRLASAAAESRVVNRPKPGR